MTNDTYISDNQGNRVAIPGTANPIAASGQTLADAVVGGDHTATVVAGAKYAITVGFTTIADGAAMGSFLMGVADVTTAANIIWVCPFNSECIISIPAGITTLHYASDVAGTTAYLRRLSDGTS